MVPHGTAFLEAPPRACRCDPVDSRARSRSPGWRHVVVACTLVLGLGIVAADFWRYDLRYALPTPRRADVRQPAAGTHVDLPPAVLAHTVPGRPVLLHFFNPACPCSRFNLDHLRALVRDHADRVTFVAVVPGAPIDSPAPSVPGLDIPAVRDADGSIAARFGVYSTPQAVLLAADRSLFFTGNYNLTRFCSDPRTAFAQQAIAALLAHRPLPPMPAAATTAYGCELPASPPPEAR